MLRVGLTGELGSGKSTVARMLAERGAVVLSSDEMGRAMMQPGQPVYAQIVERFGSSIVREDGSLDRKALAHIAFDPLHPRIEELNAIVHPAVIAEQAKQIASIAQTQPETIVVVESALIFSTRYAPGGSWSKRFDKIIVVTAPDEAKLQRFIKRATSGRTLTTSESQTLRRDAQQRLHAQQVPHPSGASYITIENSSAIDELQNRIEALWQQLIHLEQKTRNS